MFVMSPNEAGGYAQEVLPSGSITCPWLVVAEGCGPAQRAALVRSGSAGILDAPPNLQSLLIALTGLRNRLDLPDTEQDAVHGTGVVRRLEILLADDNRSNQLLLSRILKDAGHGVTVVESGGAAFDAMNGEKIDLAILDLNMPDMSGPSVIKLFRAGSIGAIRLPIMILSADATPAAKQESLEAGADEYITKPVTASTLLATIERMMAGAAARGDMPASARVVGGEAEAGTAHGHRVQSATSMLVDTDRIAAVRRIARGDAKFLDTYVTAAFAELEQAIDDLRAAIRKKDARVARDCLHIIEGTGASVEPWPWSRIASRCASTSRCRTIHRASSLAELSTTYALTKSTVLASLHSPRENTFRSGARADKMP